VHDDTLIIAIFVAVEGAHAFSAFMPSYFTVRKFASGSEDVSMLRSGYFPAVTFNLLLGIVVSVLVKNPAPLILAGLVSGGMICLYERAIQTA
jgi:hypothetical protein